MPRFCEPLRTRRWDNKAKGPGTSEGEAGPGYSYKQAETGYRSKFVDKENPIVDNVRGIQIRNHVEFRFYLAFAINALISLPRCFIVSTPDHEFVS